MSTLSVNDGTRLDLKSEQRIGDIQTLKVFRNHFLYKGLEYNQNVKLNVDNNRVQREFEELAGKCKFQ